MRRGGKSRAAVIPALQEPRRECLIGHAVDGGEARAQPCINFTPHQIKEPVAVRRSSNSRKLRL